MTDLYFFNTLSNTREKFAPRDARRVTMYVCGPTVYGPVHVGNARPAAVFDVLFRLLRRHFGESAVHYARNITDIDDKIIAAAAKAQTSTEVLALQWRQHYEKEMQMLNILSPTVAPCATEYIAQMLTMTTRLIDKGHAYCAAGHVLFHVPSFADYGALSNRRLEDMLAGARVEPAPYKKNDADFVLWKPAASDAPGWDSPWGRGRPGWHIECSAMAATCLGETIDIHGGGQDLIFPHHENEIAQSACAHGQKGFADYWLHNGHVNMDGEKMSKSLGNTRLLGEALARFPAEAVRYALLSAHYRSPLNWNDKLLEDAKASLDSLYRAVGIEAATGEATASMEDAELNRFFDCLHDDINTPRAFAVLHEMAGSANKSGDAQQRAQLLSAARFLGLLQEQPAAWFHRQSADGMADADIERLIAERKTARAQRDFAAADAIRKQLSDGGIVLEDSAGKTEWRR